MPEVMSPREWEKRLKREAAEYLLGTRSQASYHKTLKEYDEWKEQNRARKF